ncbi:MAG: ubiquinol-cytochrome c reductase iron-sulfur subunit [Gammaproteobacteria bacterium]
MSNDTVNHDRRLLLTTAATVVGGAGAVATAVPFVKSFIPSAKAKAIGAPVEVDISDIEPGELKVQSWQGKPVWILRRSKQSVAALTGLDDKLKDPASVKDQQPDYARNEYRSVKPEYLVVIGLCTHLGCSPGYVRKGSEEYDLGNNWQGGFFCPCHGSRYDLAGRVFKSVPAPTNLLVPPHQYLSDSKILIGNDSGAAS